MELAETPDNPSSIEISGNRKHDLEKECSEDKCSEEDCDEPGCRSCPNKIQKLIDSRIKILETFFEKITRRKKTTKVALAKLVFALTKPELIYVHGTTDTFYSKKKHETVQMSRFVQDLEERIMEMADECDDFTIDGMYDKEMTAVALATQNGGAPSIAKMIVSDYKTDEDSQMQTRTFKDLCERNKSSATNLVFNNAIIDFSNIRDPVIREQTNEDKMALRNIESIDYDLVLNINDESDAARKIQTAISEIWEVLNKILPDSELLRYLLTMQALGMLQKRLQKIFICVGPPGTGKSLFSTLPLLAFKNRSSVMNASTLSEKMTTRKPCDEIANLRDKIINVVDENEDWKKKEFNPQTLITISGGKKNTRRTLEKATTDPTDFLNQNWLFMNGLFTISDTEGGIWRRIFVIEFKTVFKGERAQHPLDINLQKNWETESTVYGNAMIHIYLELLRRLPSDAVNARGDISESAIQPPTRLEEPTKRYREDQNIYCQFAKDRLRQDFNCVVKTATMHEAFVKYAKDRKYEGMLTEQETSKQFRVLLDSTSIETSNDVHDSSTASIGRYLQGYEQVKYRHHVTLGKNDPLNNNKDAWGNSRPTKTNLYKNLRLI
ncbi:hypothetical protein HKX48_002123 [Thoreauomyces humboldtii]|nr:hypothetical protein HKX48_002123 [Thoreauomyces humboldtii]